MASASALMRADARELVAVALVGRGLRARIGFECRPRAVGCAKKHQGQNQQQAALHDAYSKESIAGNFRDGHESDRVSNFGFAPAEQIHSALLPNERPPNCHIGWDILSGHSRRMLAPDHR
jgi:hypothetical protein